MNSILKYTVAAFSCWIALACSLPAQDVPTPAPPQTGPLLLQGATLHTAVPGDAPKTGDILIIDGKIDEIGTITKRVEAKIIDCKGKHIYPGLIAPNTTLGLAEIGAVRATQDRQEVGGVNPNLRAIIGYNTDSRVTPTVRSNGILLAQVAPEGGTISGQSSVVQLDAWNWEDAAYRLDEGVWLNWPNLSIREAFWAPPVEKQKEAAKKNMEEIKKTFGEALAYQKAKAAGKAQKTDLRWEAMIPVFEKKRKLYVRANSEKQIASLLEFFAGYDLDLVLVGGADAGLYADQLKTRNIPVILRKTHNLPRGEDSDIDQSFILPKILQDAGVQFCISGEGYWDQRNLPFYAGTAAAYGLSKEEALQAITLNAAKILGIADRAGSLEKGKDAILIVATGDILDMRTSNVEMAFIQGRQIDLGNKQKDLYEKFKAKK